MKSIKRTCISQLRAMTQEALYWLRSYSYRDILIMDAHNPIKNLLYKSPIRANKVHYCQETTQPIAVSSHTTMEIYVLITMVYNFSNLLLVQLW